MVKSLAKHKRVLLAALKNVLSDLVSCTEHFHFLTCVHAFIKAFVWLGKLVILTWYALAKSASNFKVMVTLQSPSSVTGDSRCKRILYIYMYNF